MKKSIYLLSLILLIIGTPNFSFAHATASAKNKCKNGKRYKAKAKVNGPNGCARTVLKDNNCSGVIAEGLLRRESKDACKCIGYDWTPTSEIGAYAKGIANGSGVSVTSYKASQCSGYHAGGVGLNTPQATPISTFQGIVQSDLKINKIDYDYTNNTISFADLQGLLKINSEDFKNEYSIFTLSINIITYAGNSNHEKENTIFISQVSFINGKLQFYGNNGGFTEKDFTINALEHGQEYTLNSSNRVIKLDTDITEDMDIEVTVKSDCGNVLDGKSEIAHSKVLLKTTFDINTNDIYINILSETSDLYEIEIRDLNGNTVKTINSVEVLENTLKLVTILKDELIAKGEYFLVVIKNKNNETETDNFKLQ